MTIDQKLREAARHVHQAAERTGGLPTQPGQARRRAITTVVVGGLLVAVTVSLALVGGDGGETETAADQGPDPTVAAPEVEPISPSEGVPPPLADYWELEGTLLSVGAEPGWLCPPPPFVGYGSAIEEAEAPSALTVGVEGVAPASVSYSDGGPTCTHAPSLVLAAFEGPDLAAGVSIWPSVGDFEDMCPPAECSVDGGVEGLVLNGLPATLWTIEDVFRMWWFDANGVPLYLHASGVTRDDLMGLIDRGLDYATVPRELPAGLEVMVDQASPGLWHRETQRNARYEIEGAEIIVSTSLGSPAQGLDRTALSMATSNVGPDSDLVDLGGRYAWWTGEGGGFLFFETEAGVSVWIDGAPSKEAAIELATRIR
jgi:hypothetical protein